MKGIRTGVTALALLACTTGCFVDDQWTFAVSRSFYGSDGILEDMSGSFDSVHPEDEVLGAVAVALFLAPAAIDLVVLPVTLPRDLWVYCLGD